MDFTVSDDHRVEIKANKKRRKYLDLSRGLKIAVEHKHNGDTNSNWFAWNGSQRLGMVIGRVGNGRTNRDHPNYSITKISQNTKKSPQDLKKFAVTQTPLKVHQLMLV